MYLKYASKIMHNVIFFTSILFLYTLNVIISSGKFQGAALPISG